MDRTTQAWMTAARTALREWGEDHKTDGLPEEGRALIGASRTVKSEEDVVSALRDICWWDSAMLDDALTEIDEATK